MINGGRPGVPTLELWIFFLFFCSKHGIAADRTGRQLPQHSKQALGVLAQGQSGERGEAGRPDRALLSLLT